MVRYSKWVVCASLLVSGSVMAYTKPPFPRISVVANGGAQNYEDPSVEKRFSQFNFSMLTIYPGWGSGGMTYQQMVQNIKSMNPNTMVFPYLMLISAYPSSAGGALAPLGAKLDAQHWWVYKSGTSGSPLADPFPGQFAVNTTLFPAPDSNGDRYVNWYAKWAISNYYNQAPAIDGFWTDGVAQRPGSDGDYNLDGTVDDIFTAASWYRQGYKAYFNTLKAGMPGKFQLGNLADWGRPDTDLTDYNGMLNGGLIEGLVGHDWSAEAFSGWQGMMNWYRKTMSGVAEPKLVQFHLDGKMGDYQTMRYALASCLMDDGYFTFTYQDTPATTADTEAPWFDEYNANLGYATSAPPSASWQNGVYRRDFENGIALVNPRGNGTQQVFLEASFVKLNGTQAPTVNNGQTVTSVILNDRDGIILMRAGAQQRSTSGNGASSSSSVSSAASSSSSRASTSTAATTSSASSSSAPAVTTTTVAPQATPAVVPATAKVPAPPPVITVQ